MPSIVNSASLIEKLAEKTGKNPDEIKRLATEKTEKFSGLLTLEAAIFLLAKEAGIEDAQETVIQPTPINQLQNGEMNADVIAVVKEIFPVKEFQNKNKPGTGKRATIILADATGEIPLIFWHADTDKTTGISKGTKLLIQNVAVSSYNNQLQLSFGYKSRLTINPRQADAITLPEYTIALTPLSAIQSANQSVNIQATVEEVLPIKEFSAKTGETKKLQRLILTDEDASITAVAWNEKVSESENLKPGQKIRIENGWIKAGWQQGFELSIGSNSRIVLIEDKKEER